MTQTKLIRHGMDRVAPPPAGTVQEFTRDEQLIKALLVAKISEEAQEVAQARSFRELLEELGDLYEVLYSVAVLHGIHMNQIIQAAEMKVEARGPLLVSHNGQTVGIIHRVPLPKE